MPFDLSSIFAWIIAAGSATGVIVGWVRIIKKQGETEQANLEREKRQEQRIEQIESALEDKQTKTDRFVDVDRLSKVLESKIEPLKLECERLKERVQQLESATSVLPRVETSLTKWAVSDATAKLNASQLAKDIEKLEARIRDLEQRKHT